MKTDIRIQRTRLVKLIHVARRDLELDEDTYRLMLRNVGGTDSTTRMELRQLQAVVDHLKTKGFKVRARSSKTGQARPDRRQDNSDGARKVRALWLFLAELGALRDPSERALAAYCKRIAKVDDLHWAGHDQMQTLIETLKKWAMRFLPAAIGKLKEEVGQMHRCLPFSQVQAMTLQSAVNRAADGGFDANWSAWEVLTEALNGAREAQQACEVQG
ncbi:regulatory protein GemA [Roseateles sp. DAIF2]|uniref:gp16 family protein n=1 Tax=Roseateles sp. DAIF2 TaxID=2714952 RepID=UPI0018A27307|nr:regulatory protein GemA [Roseateles sp. DAIF2]QPF74201.1 regulatory protein GemA [Roseateles sp. DAIF2]